MRSLRYAIIALGVLSLILLFAMPLAHSARGSAEAVRGGPSLPSVLLLVYAIGTVLLLVMGVVYASKSRLSPSWILGSILLPGLVPLIMALRHLPRLREESSRPVRTISRGASSPPVAAPAPDATRTVEEPISALPLCAWTPGLDGAAPGAGSWKAAVDAFIGNEVMKAAPQFPAFRSAIARFPAPERHAAWHHVGFAFKGRGDVGTANLCFVEGLRADPDPCSANWGAIGLLRGRSWIEPFPDRPTPRLEEKARSAVVALARGLRLDELMTHTPIEDYNAAVRFLNCKVYDEAIALFDRHIDDEALGLMAFYAGGLCRLAAGRKVEVPERLAEKTDQAGLYYVTGNLVARIMGEGHRAAVTRRGTSCMAQAMVDGALYSIAVHSFGSSITTMAWRKSDASDLPLSDPSAIPNPTNADRLMLGLVAAAPAAPPVEIPREGIPTSI